jgi:hypothetical protein
MTRWQRSMFKIDALMAHAGACEHGLTVTVYIDAGKFARAISFRNK